MSTRAGKQRNDKIIVFHRWLHRSDDTNARYSQARKGSTRSLFNGTPFTGFDHADSKARANHRLTSGRNIVVFQKLRDALGG